MRRSANVAQTRRYLTRCHPALDSFSLASLTIRFRSPRTQVEVVVTALGAPCPGPAAGTDPTTVGENTEVTTPKL